MNNNLILNDRPLIVLPSLAVKIGLNESIVLQQLHYWMQRSKNVRMDRKWVYFTYDKLVEQFPFFSKSTIRRTIASLENLGLLLSDVFNKMKMDHTKWYSIDYETLKTLDNLPIENEQMECHDKMKVFSKTSTQNELTECSDSVDDMSKLDNRTVQNEQLECPTQTGDVFNLNSAIPESTSEITTKITSETSSSKTCDKNEVEEADGKTNPFQFFEQNGFGVIGGFMSGKIKSWCMNLSDKLVLEAMKVALENGSKRWNYVDAILRDWVDKGYQSVEDVHEARLALKDRQKHYGQSKKMKRTEIIPEWLHNDDYDLSHTPNPSFEKEKREFEERLKRYREERKRDWN